MRKYFFYLCLLCIFFVPFSSLGATKKITVTWTISDTSNVTGYKMYYAYNSTMADKRLACQTSDTAASSLTCENVDLNQSPVYLVIAALKLTTETFSPVVSRVIPDLISPVLDFKIDLNDGIQPQSISVNNLRPSSYQLAEIQVGDKYYVDRDYTVTNIPTSLDGLLGIKTANNDKWNSEAEYITFDINQDATLYIAYDSRAIPFPAWLTSSFTNTNQTITTIDVPLSVWEKNLSAGPVTLPGNAYGGAPPGMGTNYIVLLKANQ